MAELSTSRSHAARKSAYLVRPEDDIGAIREMLGTRRLFAAYALGQLDQEMVGLTEWWTAKGDTGRGLVLFARGGLGNALFCMGETEAVGAILALHQGPRFTYATLQPDHLVAVNRYYSLASDVMMSRMAVSKAAFQPSKAQASGWTLRRLHTRDVRALNRLYGSDGSASYYNSVHLREGVYYGIIRDDKLIAAAGTHVVGRSEGIAVVGNVFTHPKHRGQGLAQATTSAVTTDLLRDCRDVVLTVDPTNTPAVRAYQRLGYEHVSYLIEGAAVRKEPTGISSFIRRRFAAWRGRRYNGEMVVGP